MEVKLKNYLDKILITVLAVLLICFIGLWVIDTRSNELEKASKEGELKKLQEYQQILRKNFSNEVKIRNQQRYEDSITIAHLKAVKRRDSADQVKTISVLLREVKKLKLTDAELDQKLREAYEESINSPYSDPAFLP